MTIERVKQNVLDYPSEHICSDSGTVEITDAYVEEMMEVTMYVEYTEELNQSIADKIWDHIDRKQLMDIEEDADEQLEDNESYRRDPLRYVGMSQRDFLSKGAF